MISSLRLPLMSSENLKRPYLAREIPNETSSDAFHLQLLTIVVVVLAIPDARNGGSFNS